MKAAAVEEQEEKILSPEGEYAIKFAENHGISMSEALSHPMVKAYADARERIKDPFM